MTIDGIIFAAYRVRETDKTKKYNMHRVRLSLLRINDANNF